jgi:CRISPR/Cas system-associated exonuclease Cas4 (RecB family)
MAPIPLPIVTLGNLIDASHEQAQEPPRPHMGCSQIGHPCDRRLWLSFRWAVIERFDGRVLRLFRRGRNEEATVVADLEAIGATVENTGERQSRVDFGSHVSGSVDGIVSGLPTAKKRRAVLEIKTHSAKSFAEVRAKGVKEAHLTHWVQMQVYMLGMKLERGLYFAVNKDNDAIHTEWIHFDRDGAEAAVERAKRIALAERMPEPISADPEWYQCKLCSYSTFCHESKMTKEVNCRTCAHSTPKADSTWRCERHDADGIPTEFQREGCESHVLHPDLVPWALDTDHSTQVMAAYLVEGVILQNGEPDANVYSSKEIVANLKGCLSEWVGDIRFEFGGEFVE